MDLIKSSRQAVEAVTVGPGPYRLLCVGEAPGRDEDIVGEPWVGAAGKKLRWLLAEAGISSYALTNSVRHRPPNNRDPTDDEIEKCQLWLEEDIERFQPKLILALGKISRKALSSLNLDCEVVYGLHPSATLRSPRYHEKLWETILEVGKRLGYRPIKTRVVFPLTRPPEPRRAEYSLTLPTGLVVAADIETEGDENEGRMVGYSVSDGATKTWVAGRGPDFWPYDHTIMHNASYDAPELKIDLFTDSWDDTMLEGYVLRYPELGLKVMGPRLTGIDMITYNELMAKAGVTKGKSFKKALEAIPDEAIDYAVRDSEVTYRLHGVLTQDPRWNEGRLRWRYENLEKPVAAILSEMQQTGVKVDIAGLGALSVKLKEIAARHKEWLDNALGTDVNVRSPGLGQVVSQKFDLQLPVSESGNVVLDRKELLRLAHADAWDGDSGLQLRGDSGNLDGPMEQVAYHILSAREARTLDSTFCVGLAERADAEGIIRCDWKQTVTLTNRLSSGNPNLQNISARSELGKPIRRAFIVPEGYVWLRADFSQVEVRMFAHFTQDPALLACYPWNGEAEDVHDKVSRTLHIARKPAKNGLFETIYGGSPDKFARTVGIPADQAHEFHATLLREFPSIPLWAKDTEDLLLQQGYLETILGHRMYFPTAWSPVSSERAEALRSAANGRIQGSAADIMKVFMIKAHELAKKHGAWFLVQVHDELGIACPKEEVDEFMVELRQLARDIASDLGLLVPLEVSVGYADNWSDAS